MLLFNVFSTFAWNSLLHEDVTGWKLSEANTLSLVNAPVGDSQWPFTIV